jgi:hypothetical protein
VQSGITAAFPVSLLRSSRCALSGERPTGSATSSLQNKAKRPATCESSARSARTTTVRGSLTRPLPYPWALTPTPARPGLLERAREASADVGSVDEVPSDAQIIAVLRRKARKGDVNAARELREWRTYESTLMQGDGWLEVLTPRERGVVRRLIQRALPSHRARQLSVSRAPLPPCVEPLRA